MIWNFTDLAILSITKQNGFHNEALIMPVCGHEWSLQGDVNLSPNILFFDDTIAIIVFAINTILPSL